MSDNVSFSGTTVRVGETTWDVAYPIRGVRLIDGRVLVLYDYWKGPRHRQFQNLEAFDLAGKHVWTAEHPTNETADAYVDFTRDEPLTLWNFGGFVCVVDPRTGKLVSAEFTK